MKSKLSILGFVLILSALIVSGCGATTAEPTAGLANPAAVYCEGQGYTLEIRTDADGGQYGVCIFPDGSECEEWAFYRGECSPASEAAVETPATEEPTAVPAVTPTEVAVETPSQTPTEEVIQPSETVSLDETWNQYVNYRLGFSIKFPKTMVTFYGSCRWNEENGDHSYRPDPAIVPVKVFEDVDTVYIAGEYYHELAGETTETTADGGMRYYYAECNKVNNSLALLQDPENHYQQMWKMVVKDIYNDDELDGFIKSRYGAGCSLGEKVASEQQDGVYDVRIQGDGKDLPETQCPLNYGTVLKYYPQANRVIAWDLGQAYTFAANETYSVTYDGEMVESFRFIETPGLPVSSDDDPYPGWASYVNTDYGFAFRYPPTWVLEEQPNFLRLGQGTLNLDVWYMRAMEAFQIGPGGVPAGDWEDRGVITFMGQEVSRVVLVYEGKDKGVFYNGTSGMQVDELMFAISLQDDPGVGVDYQIIDIPEIVEVEVDHILGSFERVLPR